MFWACNTRGQTRFVLFLSSSSPGCSPLESWPFCLFYTLQVTKKIQKSQYTFIFLSGNPDSPNPSRNPRLVIQKGGPATFDWEFPRPVISSKLAFCWQGKARIMGSFWSKTLPFLAGWMPTQSTYLVVFFFHFSTRFYGHLFIYYFGNRVYLLG